MTRKFLLSLGVVLTVVASVAAMSAYEAHVINVTAHIENALKVFPLTGELDFGTVFPQEHREEIIAITTSESFCDTEQTRVLAIDYKIVQKPKPLPVFVSQIGEEDARKWCHDNYPTEPYPGQTTQGELEWSDYLANCYPFLCPYLSKTPVAVDPDPYTDYGVNSFHDPWDPSSVAIGTIHKNNDLQDDWIIDLDVPCFEGYCAQDWIHYGWELPYELEEETFGCDLWVEVTKIY